MPSSHSSAYLMPISSFDVPNETQGVASEFLDTGSVAEPLAYDERKLRTTSLS